MKKQKRSIEWQEQDLDSETIGFDLDLEDSDAEDEEIIELEDILEAPEDSADLDIQELDEKSELDLQKLDLEFASTADKIIEDDLPSEFPFEKETIAEARLKQDAGTEGGSALEAELSALLEAEDKTGPLPDRPSVNEMADSAKVVEPALDSQVAAAEVGPSLEEYVDQIENRLLQAVQQIVESKLPEVVRAILREEIDRLMQESEKEKV